MGPFGCVEAMFGVLRAHTEKLRIHQACNNHASVPGASGDVSRPAERALRGEEQDVVQTGDDQPRERALTSQPT